MELLSIFLCKEITKNLSIKDKLNIRLVNKFWSKFFPIEVIWLDRVILFRGSGNKSCKSFLKLVQNFVLKEKKCVSLKVKNDHEIFNVKVSYAKHYSAYNFGITTNKNSTEHTNSIINHFSIALKLYHCNIVFPEPLIRNNIKHYININHIRNIKVLALLCKVMRPEFIDNFTEVLFVNYLYYGKND